MRTMQIIKRIAQPDGHACDLAEGEAHELFAGMLDGGLPDLELGAVLIALHLKSESGGELLGFHRALCERLYTLTPPVAQARPVVLPAYGGARTQHNLLPLLGLLLRRLGIPVLFHGTLEGSGRLASVYILRELGVLPSASLRQAQATLEQERIAYVPTAALCPGLAALLALRNRLGVRNSAHLVAKLLDPFGGGGVLVIGASRAPTLDKLAGALLDLGASALLLASTEGEPFASPRRRPRIERFQQGAREILFEEEAGPVKSVAGLPASIDAHATAEWMRLAMAGEAPIPHPLVNQLACCLYACGYTDDMNQAKAIAAVEAGSLVPGAQGSSRRAAQHGA